MGDPDRQPEALYVSEIVNAEKDYRKTLTFARRKQLMLDPPISIADQGGGGIDSPRIYRNTKSMKHNTGIHFYLSLIITCKLGLTF